MSPAPSTVSLLPWYLLAEPYLVALFNDVLTPVLLGWIGYLMSRYLGIRISDSANARFQTAAQNAAGRIFAGLEPAAATMKIDVHSPLIAAEVPKVESKVADAIRTLGIAPDDVAEHVRDIVAGKLGQLQASSAPVGATSAATLPVSLPGEH